MYKPIFGYASEDGAQQALKALPYMPLSFQRARTYELNIAYMLEFQTMEPLDGGSMAPLIAHQHPSAMAPTFNRFIMINESEPDDETREDDFAGKDWET